MSSNLVICKNEVVAAKGNRRQNMRTPAYEKLLSFYPNIIKSMPGRFDSHDFILKLAQENQQLYVQALQEYAETERPFQILHGLLAQRLLDYSELVSKVGEQNSEDIFKQVNSAMIWQKIVS
jgi:hypothetical protein